MMRRLWDKFRKIVESVGRKDDVSWFSHWVLVVAGSVTPAAVVAIPAGPLWGLVAGNLASDAWLHFFNRKEVLNWQKHKMMGDDLKRWSKDGLLDLVGPVLNRLIWFFALIWELGVFHG